MTSCEIIACSLKRFVTTFEIKIIIIMTDTKSSLSINGWVGTSLLGCQDTQKSRSYQRHPPKNVTAQINQKTYLQYYPPSTLYPTFFRHFKLICNCVQRHALLNTIAGWCYDIHMQMPLIKNWVTTPARSLLTCSNQITLKQWPKSWHLLALDNSTRPPG